MYNLGGSKNQNNRKQFLYEEINTIMIHHIKNLHSRNRINEGQLPVDCIVELV